MRPINFEIRESCKNYIRDNHNKETIGQMAQTLDVSRWIVVSVMKELGIESSFRCYNGNRNSFWGDISYLNFRMCVDMAAKTFGDPEDIFNLAIVEYCKSTNHDIDEANEKFRDFFINDLKPKLHIFKNRYGIARTWYEPNIDLLLLAIKEADKYNESYGRRKKHV